MKKIVLAVLLFVASVAFAQTEDDLIRWVEQNKPLADAGQISLLEFNREMYRRIAIIPGDTYQYKAQNLRWIGGRIDILEALEAGTITREQAARRLTQLDADFHEADRAEHKARLEADIQRAEMQRIRQEQAAEQRRQAEAHQEAQRRALILQMLQNNQARQPYQHTPYQMQVPQQTNCTSMWNGAAWQTHCY